jgi:hypothetical protein
MGAAIPLRTDYSASELRLLAKRAEDAGQTRRLLSLAAVVDGMSREEAAEIGAMDRQTLPIGFIVQCERSKRADRRQSSWPSPETVA